MSGEVGTATVETLTAEVRVLKVGNRQITLSVAKQLDQAELGEMEVFGRIRVGDGVLVIGKHHETGVLVTSNLRGANPGNFYAYIELGDDAPKPVVCKRSKFWHGDGFGNFKFDDQPIYLHRGSAQPCEQDHGINERCAYWEPGAARALIEEQLVSQRERWERAKALYDTAVNAPLIVLAGLR